MKQIKVALTDETKAYLDEQAKKNGRNLSEEMRVRMEQSQMDDRFDAATNSLARDVMWLARLVGFQGAMWHTDKNAFEALEVALGDWLNSRRDSLDLKAVSGNPDPQAWGKAVAHSYKEMGLIKHRPGGDNMEGKR